MRVEIRTFYFPTRHFSGVMLIPLFRTGCAMNVILKVPPLHARIALNRGGA